MNKERASGVSVYGGLDISDIAGRVRFKEKTIVERGHSPVSPEVAIALVIGDCGKDLLRGPLGIFNDNNIVPDINSVFRGLSHKDREIFSRGLGGITLGSIAKALEQAVRDSEWRDNVFITNFNLAISGISLRAIGGEYKEITDQNYQRQEAEKIFNILRRSNTFLSFFEDPETESPSRENLPKSMQTFLKQNPAIDLSINLVVPFFKASIMKLSASKISSSQK